MMDAIKRLKTIGEEIQLLIHSAAILDWDQQTQMPSRGAEGRAKQLALLQGILHEKITQDTVSKLLRDLGADEENPLGDSSLPWEDRAYVRYFHRLHSKEKKLPQDLVRELAEATSLGQSVWVEARKKSDFSFFQGHLKKIISLLRKKAEYYGFSDHPYDALLDDYEPWARTRDVTAVFEEVKKDIVSLLKKITSAKQVNDTFLHKNYPANRQETFNRQILEDIGYDFTRGRLDIAAHPFTTTLGGDDVRITTRYRENFLNTSVFGTIHECGHALYEMGFSENLKGNLLAEGASLGIHESQSRTWENIIGRSLPFWTYYFPKISEIFPENCRGLQARDFFKGVNKVEPSFIRVDADEVTYSLHIILRFELEKGLITGDIKVEELPQIWNHETRELFGILPENDAEGVLQDVHWSAGLIGYFPTYSLGNLYSAQFYSALNKALPEAEEHIKAGNFTEILSWYRNNIHSYGSSLTAEELCKKATGEPLNPKYFTEYLTAKYSEVYDL